MATGFHYLLARQRQAELSDRAERARRAREAGQLAVEARDRRLRERVIAVLRRWDAARTRRHAASGPAADADGLAITLRLAGEADGTALADLAGLDSASVPAAPVLIAEAGGVIRAALSLHDGAIVADPFHRTLAAQQLLRTRAAQLRGDRGGAWRRRVRGQRRGSARHLPANPSAAVGAVASDHHQ